MKRESDSARAHAQDLSQQLSEQFKVQADALNLANRLARDLKKKEQLEKKQQAQIDSLENQIASSSSQAASDEIHKLRQSLAVKLKEQKLQRDQAKFQDEKIERLNESKELLALKTDSLEKNLANRSEENAVLTKKLNESASRIDKYEGEIDSLNNISNSDKSDPIQMAELENLKNQLTDLAKRDQELKYSVQSKDNEIANL